jgi:hypothetical protein
MPVTDLALKKDPKLAAAEALMRAAAAIEAGAVAWCPVFADVLLAGNKIGHVVSDSPKANTTWSFHPLDERRLTKCGQPLDRAIPQWAKGAGFGPFLTLPELEQPASIATPDSPLRESALRAGKLVARRVFRERGNHSEAHLSEQELATWIAAGCELVLRGCEPLGSDRAR